MNVSEMFVKMKKKFISKVVTFEIFEMRQYLKNKRITKFIKRR